MNHCCLWLLLFTCLLQATNVECLLPSFSLRRHHPLHQSPYTRNHDFQSCLFQQTSQRNWDHHENTTTTTIEDSIGVANEFKGNRIRFRGRVAYDGSGFRGWQVQSRGRTCQGVLEQVLSLRFNRPVKIVGAGRTDAGVHARGQAFHFDLHPDEVVTSKGQNDVDPSSPTDKADYYESFCHQLQRSLNRLLEQDIRVYNVMRTPTSSSSSSSFLTMDDSNDPCSDTSSTELEWHSIYRAKQKLYTYRISLKPNAITCHPLQRYTRVHVDGDIDPEHLQRILRHYEGEHDFRAFAGAIEANLRKDGLEHKNTVRTVYSVDLIDEGESGHYRIEILLKGALYKMVRNMVGTALDVCKGRLSEEAMLQMLHHCSDDDSEEVNGKKQFSRVDNKCKPAPPEGLTLEKVYYDDEFF